MNSDSPPTLSAGVVFFDRSSKVLLVHQNYARHAWSLPGGRLDPGESPHEAAAREVREEIGVSVELVHLIGIYYIERAHPGIGFAFLGRLPNGATPRLVDVAELDDIGWFTLADLPEPVMPSLPVVLGDAAAGRRGVSATIDGSEHPV